MDLNERQRLQLADEIVRRVDTVTLLKCEEVTDIRMRSLAGEFDQEYDSLCQ